MDYNLKQLEISEIAMIKRFFADVFTNEPWNDDWSDERQLDSYITDLAGQSNSLTLGYFADGEPVGLSMGHIRHWYSGTEYYIDEFCIARQKQGQGVGTSFLRDIERFILEKGMTQIFLQTERTVPAYHFYRKNGFAELEAHVSFAKRLG